MMQDPIFLELRESLSIKSDDIRIGRIEGCFFKIDVWLEMIEIISIFYTRESIQNQQPSWPMEACLFPTIVGHFMKGKQPDCRNIVRTKPVKRKAIGKIIRNFKENLVQVEDIDKALNGRKENKCIGLKWFSTDLNHPARNFVKETLENGG